VVVSKLLYFSNALSVENLKAERRLMSIGIMVKKSNATYSYNKSNKKSEAFHI
jgi:hypothetical protein